MYAFRTRFKKEIVAEFFPPIKKSNKVIILCGGMPGYPGKKEDLMEFLSKKGFWVFIPRYRGTWESDGEFLNVSPHQDILDVMDGIQSGFTNLWSHSKFKIRNSKFYLIGSSFGGPAAILASTDKRVKKVVVLSPVVDWYAEKRSDVDRLRDFTENAFGSAYRFTRLNWNKFKLGGFYDPMSEADKIDGKKLMIIHAKDDKIVGYKPSEKFANKTGSKLVLLKTGGHLSTSIISIPKFWKKISNFFS